MTVAAIAIGCGGSPSSADVDVPRIERPPTSGLVWVRDEAGIDHTHWVALDGSPLSGLPIDGALWADGQALWQPLTEVTTAPLHEEEPGPGESPPPRGEVELHRVVLRELVADARVVAVEAPALGAVHDARHELTLEASVGSYLFFVERLYVEAWGAHGAEEVRSIVWDLRTAAPAEIPTDRELAAWEAEASRRAEQIDEIDEGAGLSLVALHPRWEDGALRVDLRVAAEACYACGDGAWSDYTRSLLVPLTAPPERLARPLPAWARVTAERSGGRLMGFTLVEEEAPAAILDSLSR